MDRTPINMLDVVIIADDPVRCAGLAALTGQLPFVNCVSETMSLDSETSSSMAKSHLTIASLQSGKDDFLHFLKERDEEACCPVLLADMDVGITSPDLLVEHGIYGLVRSPITKEALSLAVSATVRRNVWCAFAPSDNSAERIVSLVKNDALRALVTARELEVLDALLGGMDNAGIAAMLHLSHSTVKAHLHRIMRKAQVHDRVSLMQLAMSKMD